jgi:hypothetical protein
VNIPHLMYEEHVPSVSYTVLYTTVSQPCTVIQVKKRTVEMGPTALKHDCVRGSYVRLCRTHPDRPSELLDADSVQSAELHHPCHSAVYPDGI